MRHTTMDLRIDEPYSFGRLYGSDSSETFGLEIGKVIYNTKIPSKKKLYSSLICGCLVVLVHWWCVVMRWVDCCSVCIYINTMQS